MSEAVRDLRQMLAGMDPLLRAGRFVFVTVDAVPVGVDPVMSFVEDEGLSLILDQAQADAAALRYDAVMAWITLQVHSAIDGVGLTAAVSGALGHQGISCNVVAATFHDHLFVPVADAGRAVDILRELARHNALG